MDYQPCKKCKANLAVDRLVNGVCIWCDEDRAPVIATEQTAEVVQ